MAAAQRNTTISVIVILLTIVSKLDGISAKCCREERVATKEVETHGRSYDICFDGILRRDNDFFCGKGNCDIFGCNCDGGCRTSPIVKNRADAISLFNNREQLIRNSEILRKKFENPQFNMLNDAGSLYAPYENFHDLVAALLKQLKSAHVTEEVKLKLDNFGYQLQNFADTLQKRNNFLNSDEEARKFYNEYLDLQNQFGNLLSD